MKLSLSLIDNASNVCGGDANLSRKLGVSTAMVSMLRTGKRKLSPELAAELADMTGDDAREAVIAAVIEGAKGTRHEGAMREILGKALAAGVAGMSAFSYNVALTGSMDHPTRTPIESVRFTGLYIVSILRKLRGVKRSKQSGDFGTASFS